MTDPIDTEAERAKHVKPYKRSQHCRCMAAWPCPSLVLLDEIDRLRAQIEVWRDAHTDLYERPCPHVVTSDEGTIAL